MEGKNEEFGSEFDEFETDEEINTPIEDEEDYDFGGSEPSPLGGIYGLFKDTLNMPDSKKVSNLNPEELGRWNLSVRDCERIALIANTFHHPGVAKFFQGQSKIVTDTAMSKKGWFTELFVTSKRYASRDSSSSVLGLPQAQQKDNKWKIFSGGGSQKTNLPVED